MAPHVLFGANPAFHCRYTTQYHQDRSHLFLLSNGGPLPDVALRSYPVGSQNNGIWWLVNNEDGQPTVHFRKESDFECIDFAVLKNGVDDVIPLAQIDRICGQKKHLRLGEDRENFNCSEVHLIWSLAVFYLGHIPPAVLFKFGRIDVPSLIMTRNDLLRAFTEDLGHLLIIYRHQQAPSQTWLSPSIKRNRLWMCCVDAWAST